MILLLALILLASVPSVLTAQVPRPEAILGFVPGTEGRLADWSEISAYFESLASASPRVEIQALGRSTQDRPFYLILISAPQKHNPLDRRQKKQHTQAHPRGVSGTREALIREGRTILLATASIHSGELGASQMVMELAYELAAGMDPETLKVLESVIFLLVPSLNPDGLDLVTEWYRQTRGTPAEGTLPPLLYHPYAGHDNNRDWYMLTQQETRLAVEKIHNVWHPQIVFDLHEMGSYGARLFIPPYAEPLDPNLDPLLEEGILRLGSRIFSTLVGNGRKGILTHAVYDALTPARAYQHYHAGIRILSEVATTRLGTSLQIPRESLRSGRGYQVNRRSWNFPVPWEGGRWSLRDVMDYEKEALKVALTDAAENRELWLRNFLQVGLNAIGRRVPHAFVLPADQADPQGLADLLEVLTRGGVEVEAAAAPFVSSSARLVSPPFGRPRSSFPAGSHVIRLQQPYGSYAKTLLEIQEYSGPPLGPGQSLPTTYDVTAQTLGIQLGVEVHQIDTPLEAELEPAAVPATQGAIGEGTGKYWLFSHANGAFARLANRLHGKGRAVFWAPNGFRAEGRGFPSGTLLFGWEDLEGLRSLIEDLPVTVHPVRRRPPVAWRRIRPPRIGLYRSYLPAMDEGWTRWALERNEFSYENLVDGQVREENLSRFDVIILPHQTPEQIQYGLGTRYPKEFRGGLGETGLRRLREFAESGGTLLAFGSACELVLSRWSLPAQSSTRRLSSRELFAPGSLLRLEVNNRHPIGYGLQESVGGMFFRSSAMELSGGLAIARYSGENLLLSGWLTGGEHLEHQAAVSEFPVGRGRVVLMGIRPQFRGQTRATFKFLFNTLYYSTQPRLQ